MNTAELLRVVSARDGNACAWTGHTSEAVNLKLYRRGIGTANLPTNWVLIDRGVQEDLRSDATLSTIAQAWGYDVPGWVNPADVPVFYAHEHVWCALEGDTRRPITSVEATDRMLTVYGDAWAWWNATARDTPQAHALATRGGAA